jgi:hypothetical protein
VRNRFFLGSGLVVIIASTITFGSCFSMARGADSVTNDVLQASRANLAAFSKRDLAGMLQFESSGFVHIHDDGTLTGRDEHLQFAPNPNTSHWTSQSVRLIGDVAVVSGASEETEQYTGGAIVTHYYRTEIWARQNGRWLIEQQQVTIIPPVNHPVTFPTPKNLDRFAGQYEWWPGYVETMSVKGGHLYSIIGGNPPDLLYFVGPESTTETDDPAIGTFYHDANGRVAGYLYRNCYGETARFPRIK